jgi:hypothetical protein
MVSAMPVDKAEALALLESAWEDPLTKRSGDIFTELGERVVRQLLADNREVVADVLRDLMLRGNGARALFAVEMAGKYRLTELLSDIRALDARVQRGEAFHPSYSEWTNRAIRSLSTVDR